MVWSQSRNPFLIYAKKIIRAEDLQLTDVITNYTTRTMYVHNLSASGADNSDMVTDITLLDWLSW